MWVDHLALVQQQVRHQLILISLSRKRDQKKAGIKSSYTKSRQNKDQFPTSD
jgi:hypothetical protein